MLGLGLCLTPTRWGARPAPLSAHLRSSGRDLRHSTLCWALAGVRWLVATFAAALWACSRGGAVAAGVVPGQPRLPGGLRLGRGAPCGSPVWPRCPAAAACSQGRRGPPCHCMGVPTACADCLTCKVPITYGAGRAQPELCMSIDAPLQNLLATELQMAILERCSRRF